jgi:hypothetical protein
VSFFLSPNHVENDGLKAWLWRLPVPTTGQMELISTSLTATRRSENVVPSLVSEIWMVQIDAHIFSNRNKDWRIRFPTVRKQSPGNKISCDANSLNQTVLCLTFPLPLLFLLGLSYILPSLFTYTYFFLHSFLTFTFWYSGTYECDSRWGLDSWLDLLTTLTHDSELQAITAPSLISTICKSPLHPLSLFQSVVSSLAVSLQRLLTVMILQHPRLSPLWTAAPFQLPPFFRLQYRTHSVAPIFFLITPRQDQVGNTVSKSTSIVACISVAAGTC